MPAAVATTARRSARASPGASQRGGALSRALPSSQCGHDQAVKLLAPVSVDPADVSSASRADRDLPRPSRKPRERILGRSEVNATRCRIETTNAVVEASWIDEHVLVSARHLDPMNLG